MSTKSLFSVSFHLKVTSRYSRNSTVGPVATMMNSVVSNSVVSKVIKTVCENQGCMDFKSLKEIIDQHFTMPESILFNVLHDNDKLAVTGQTITPDCLIVPKTSLRICQITPGDCPDCDKLHLCRYFICGNCRFGKKCKNSHDLASSYNTDHLRRHGLEDLSEKQLFQLLLQNDPYLLPEICTHYNRGNGEHGSCKFPTRCINLHLCLHFAQGDCMFGTRCKRAHIIDDHNKKILIGRGFSAENIQNLVKIYRNKFIIYPVLPTVKHGTPHPPQSPTKPLPTCSPSSSGATSPISEADRNEICLYFIRKHCSFKEKCVRVHYNLPYKWEVMENSGTWKDLPNMEDIEKAYCDPAQDTSSPHQPTVSSSILKYLPLTYLASARDDSGVNFLTMKFNGAPVRRLSTASSASKPPHFILTTEWLWYWQDDDGKWYEYGNEGSSSVKSQTLENVYQADREMDISLNIGKHHYIVNFKEMSQQNINYKTKRKVRRRPRFVSTLEVEAKLKSVSSSSTTASVEAVPAHWNQSAIPEYGYKLIPLTTSMKEHEMVVTLFKNTMPQRVVHSVRRIQNPSLWKVFEWQKEQMKLRSGGTIVDQRYLFHGTQESLIDAICDQNFDWRVCGVHGTRYGRGSYFARDASYSDRYARVNDSRKKIMFVALVLVGQFTRGDSSYVRPPAKGTGKECYDTCVDSESNPSIFVVFDKLQIYPHYIIDYS